MSGCSTGEELQRAWDTLRQEANQSSDYLGKEIEGPLQSLVEGAGGGHVDGRTRRELTAWIEDTRAAVLEEALARHSDQRAQPVWSHPQLDKLSQGWVFCLPGPNGFSQAEFSETVARFLCLPSPCCQPRV